MSRSDAESSGGQSASARLRVDLQALPVLVVDDEADNLDAFRFNFRKSFRILTAQSAEQGLAILSQERVAVIVADQRMPKITGLQFLQRAKEIAPLAVPIIVTAYTDVDVLIEAINMGHIYRYVTKPWDSKEMRGVLLQALERYHLLAENARLSEQLAHYAGYLEKELHGAFDFGQLIGDSPALSAALQRVEQVARTQATVLLRGESGTGKELVAHAIHINSPRSHRPFVRHRGQPEQKLAPVNAGALGDRQDLLAVCLRASQAEDARDRGDNHGVAPAQDAACCRETELIEIVVAR